MSGLAIFWALSTRYKTDQCILPMCCLRRQRLGVKVYENVASLVQAVKLVIISVGVQHVRHLGVAFVSPLTRGRVVVHARNTKETARSLLNLCCSWKRSTRTMRGFCSPCTRLISFPECLREILADSSS